MPKKNLKISPLFFKDDTTWVLRDVLREANDKPVLMWYTLGYHCNDAGVKYWRRMGLKLVG